MSNTKKETQTAAPQQQSLRVRYEETQARHASQVLLNVSEDEMVLNFSSGMMPDPNTGEAHLPIHTRIAMSRLNAQKLAALLNQALAQKNPPAATPATATAKLPEIDDSEKSSKK
ncbi:DUF3467 domain-containing protein [Candidatus Venteria ishoeyi]|uniref:DUF3467 domain-containing protein n=1 Tax=Candidatus Venteria ishoeyi TaxID=1899563 RepID=A0A1H6FHF1_9GAMM|nr:DUF3467 domain-containing protein [Candidatus Venteria ishoeyi]MDM8546834.1 hypothetical protein [Candidatus Venteria ishoeyi]SEH08424.1 Uncharacterised protein [Candidatus Venteria ishoeyi]